MLSSESCLRGRPRFGLDFAGIGFLALRVIHAPLLVAHGQVDDEVQGLSGWKKTHRHCAPAGKHGANMIVQYLKNLLSPSWDSDQQEQSRSDHRSEF